MKQGKVIICNIIMVLISIAAIVTLYLGSFMKITVKLSINEETAQKLAGDSADLSAMGDFEFTLPLSIEIKDKDLIFSVTPEGAKKSTSELIAREVSGILDTLLTAADDLLKQVINLFILSIENTRIDTSYKSSIFNWFLFRIK